MQDTGNEARPTITLSERVAAHFQEMADNTGLKVEEVLEAIVPEIALTMSGSYTSDLTPQDLENATCRAVNDIARKGRAGRRRSAKTEMRVNVSAASYGLFSEAGIVLGCSPQKALDMFINGTDCLCEWSNGGFRT